ncbi:hypothetical protein WR25_19482 [Diploscapter pachys]|uniref:HAD family hydrolase n=1 Tax=Diploscapter pachys TaxID=2018661 RepID=A0A2A2K0K2_9BILA|nr:hypothetical protein WR25_19482 [Diploscapter pachys]
MVDNIGTLTGGVLSWGSYQQIIGSLYKALEKATHWIKEKIQKMLGQLPTGSEVNDIPNIPKEFPPLCDLIPMFEKLRSKGLKIALVSANNKNSSIKAMEDAGIWKYFDYSLIGDEIVRMKPDPYAAEEVGKHFGVKPAEMIMVGDAPSDVGMANNAKLLAGVAVLTNDIYLEKLRKETKYMIKDVCELPELIEKEKWLD